MQNHIAGALDIIDTEGHEALSIRRLARTMNYSRSVAAYLVGSMGELDAEIRECVLADLAIAMLGDPPYRPGDRDWFEACAARMVDWIDRFPNRAAYIAGTRPAADTVCPVLGDVVPLHLGRGLSFELSTNYMVGMFKFAYEIVHAFDDVERAIQACGAHFATAWATIRAAAGDDPAVLAG